MINNIKYEAHLIQLFLLFRRLKTFGKNSSRISFMIRTRSGKLLYMKVASSVNTFKGSEGSNIRAITPQASVSVGMRKNIHTPVRDKKF